MKNVKKLGSILLALVMMISMVTSAMATTVTIDSTNGTLDGHKFEAYQIFQGNESDGTLSDVEWGSGIDQSAFLDALQRSDKFMIEKPELDEDGEPKTDEAGKPITTKVNAFADCKVDDPAGVAEALASVAKGFDDPAAKEFAKLAYQHKQGSGSALETGDGATNELEDGYYLIVDATVTDGKDDVKNAALLQVVGEEIEIKVKTDTTTFEKKVMDTNDSTGETTGWQDSADYDIGDHVPFQLKATLPNNVSAYSKYEVTFNDEMSKGLTFDGNIVIRIGDKVVYSDDPTIPVDDEIKTLLEEHPGYAFTVEKGTGDNNSTTLKIACTDVKLLGATDSSVITVNYTATLNDQANIGSAGNTNKANLEYSNNPNDTGKGKTPDDTVIVFTYKTVIDKVDQDEKPLEGAAFKLEKFIKGAGTVEVEIGTGENKPTITGTWELVREFKLGDTTTKFSFEGLDDGIYQLTETETPAGYNKIDPVVFQITATHTNDGDSDPLKLTDLNGNKISGAIELNFTSSEGSLTTNVVNRSGSILPETGGIGTTIFYVVGGILVAGAAVLLITQKRMNRKH